MSVTAGRRAPSPVATSHGGTGEELENLGARGDGSVATSKVGAGPHARIGGEVRAPRSPSELRSEAARGATWHLGRATRGDRGRRAQGAPRRTRRGDRASGGAGWPQEGGLASEIENCGAENGEPGVRLARRKRLKGKRTRSRPKSRLCKEQSLGRARGGRERWSLGPKRGSLSLAQSPAPGSGQGHFSLRVLSEQMGRTRAPFRETRAGASRFLQGG